MKGTWSQTVVNISSREVSSEAEIRPSEVVVEKLLVTLNKPVGLKPEPSLLMNPELWLTMGSVTQSQMDLPFDHQAMDFESQEMSKLLVI